MMTEFEDVVAAHDLPSADVLPARYETVEIRLPDGRRGRAAVYRHYSTWAAVTQLGEIQRWYGLDSTRLGAIRELEAAIDDDQPLT